MIKVLKELKGMSKTPKTHLSWQQEEQQEAARKNFEEKLACASAKQRADAAWHFKGGAEGQAQAWALSLLSCLVAYCLSSVQIYNMQDSGSQSFWLGVYRQPNAILTPHACARCLESVQVTKGKFAGEKCLTVSAGLCEILENKVAEEQNRAEEFGWDPGIHIGVPAQMQYCISMLPDPRRPALPPDNPEP
eukprot:1136813-Pelagomonas_calceolata.AAC.1